MTLAFLADENFHRAIVTGVQRELQDIVEHEPIRFFVETGLAVMDEARRAVALLTNADAEGIARIVLESVQAMLLKIALQMAHDDYTDRRERQRQGIALAKAAGRSGGRKGDRATHARIVALREAGKSIAKTAELADCDRSTVKRVWAAHRAAQVQEPSPQRNHRERNR